MPLYLFALNVPTAYRVQAEATEELPDAAAAMAHGVVVAEELSGNTEAVPAIRLSVTDEHGTELLRVPVCGDWPETTPAQKLN